MAKRKPAGWIESQWENPETKKVAPKQLHYEKAVDLIVACGAYE